MWVWVWVWVGPPLGQLCTLRTPQVHVATAQSRSGSVPSAVCTHVTPPVCGSAQAPVAPVADGPLARSERMELELLRQEILTLRKVRVCLAQCCVWHPVRFLCTPCRAGRDCRFPCAVSFARLQAASMVGDAASQVRRADCPALSPQGTRVRLFAARQPSSAVITGAPRISPRTRAALHPDHPPPQQTGSCSCSCSRRAPSQSEDVTAIHWFCLVARGTPPPPLQVLESEVLCNTKDIEISRLKDSLREVEARVRRLSIARPFSYACC